MTKLSVNINELATLRNAGCGNSPDILKTAVLAGMAGAHGITAHPLPGSGLLGYDDILKLRSSISTELNIAGNPTDLFIRLVRELHPEQVTLMCGDGNATAADRAWDTKHNLGLLSEVCQIFNTDGIKTSIFVEPDVEMVRYASDTGCKCAVLDAQHYAKNFEYGQEAAIEPYIYAAEEALKCGLELNAGRGFNLANIGFFCSTLPETAGISVGHGLICDALYIGLDTAVKAYLAELENI